MVYKGEISIQQVLAEIRENTGRTFFVQFVRTTGKNIGSIKTVAKCLYGKSKGPGQSASNNERAERKRSLHIERGTLPCSDYDNGEYLTPLIGCIISYNGYKVKH